MTAPLAIQQELDQHQAHVRDLIEKDHRLADEINSNSSIGVLLNCWGKIVADDIFTAGDYRAMQIRALAWVSNLEEITK